VQQAVEGVLKVRNHLRVPIHSMNWKKRVREIAARNPDALHPILRQGASAARGEKVWDRVDWQTKGEGKVDAKDAARPILLVLRWLHRHQLLTDCGAAMLSAPAEEVALTSSLVVPLAVRFLDSHYEAWQSSEGISLIMDASPGSGRDAENTLEQMWFQYTRPGG
jgi:hypothetical protein